MLTKASEINEVDVIKTGLFIDKLIGIGGIPKKRIVEIIGDPGTGKSTLCAQIVAAAQTAGETTVWVDVEGSFTPLYTEKLGVDNSKLDVLQDRSAEVILNEARKFVDNESYGLMIVDSIGALSSEKEQEKDVGEVSPASQARLVSSFIRKIAPVLPSKNIAIIVINHTKDDWKTGAMICAGGKSLDYNKTVSIRLKRNGQLLKSGENIIGFQIEASVYRKNKMASTVGQKITVDYINDHGFQKKAQLIEDALAKGIIEKRGNSFYFEGEKLAVGVTKLKKLVEDTPDLAEKLEAKL